MCERLGKFLVVLALLTPGARGSDLPSPVSELIEKGATIQLGAVFSYTKFRRFTRLNTKDVCTKLENPSRDGFSRHFTDNHAFVKVGEFQCGGLDYLTIWLVAPEGSMKNKIVAVLKSDVQLN